MSIQSRVKFGKKFEKEISNTIKNSIVVNKRSTFVVDGKLLTIKKLIDGVKNRNLSDISIRGEKYDILSGVKKIEIKGYNELSLKNGIIYSEILNIKTHDQINNLTISRKKYNKIIYKFFVGFYDNLCQVGEQILSTSDIVQFKDISISTSKLKIYPDIRVGWKGYNRMCFKIYYKD